jgi:hypothetical protein
MPIVIPDVVAEIGIEEYINAFLVDKDVRPGMMLQPPDYQERTEKDPIMSAMITNILATFPSLVTTVTDGRSTIFAKRAIPLDTIQTDKQLGVILGYPCAEEFAAAKDIDDKEYTYSIELIVKLHDTVTTEKKEIQLLVNVCLTDAKKPYFEAMAAAAQAAIRADPVLSPLVESVYVDIHIHIPPTMILNKLVRAEPLTEGDLHEFHNFSDNLGFTEEGLVNYPFDFTNPLHRGIGIYIVSMYLHDPTSAFYPLQQYPGKDTEVYEITKALEMEIREALDAAKNVAEGGRRRRKSKTRRNKKN